MGYCSPTSNISTSHLSIPDAEFADADGEFEDPLPALGTAKALYPFEGLSHCLLAIKHFKHLPLLPILTITHSSCAPITNTYNKLNLFLN